MNYYHRLDGDLHILREDGDIIIRHAERTYYLMGLLSKGQFIGLYRFSLPDDLPGEHAINHIEVLINGCHFNALGFSAVKEYPEDTDDDVVCLGGWNHTKIEADQVLMTGLYELVKAAGKSRPKTI